LHVGVLDLVEKKMGKTSKMGRYLKKPGWFEKQRRWGRNALLVMVMKKGKLKKRNFQLPLPPEESIRQCMRLLRL